MEKLDALLTEARNPATENLDQLSTIDLIRVMHTADREAVAAVERETENITRAVEAIVAQLSNGGRLFYMGAGTSGRLGVLDASECPPTYNTPPELVQGLIAGGDTALRWAVERAEDDAAQGQHDLEDRGFSSKDVLVGIAASGRTPYVLGGIDYARSTGAVTIGLSCVPTSQLAQRAEIAITPATGPEIVTGSTRMKAGTATKLVLNMLSTASLVKLGYIYGNLMVNMQPTNAKLEDRAERIIVAFTNLPKDQAQILLKEAGSVKTAIMMHQLKLTRGEAEARLAAAKGRLRAALAENVE